MDKSEKQILITLGKKLKSLRVEKAFTQEKLAFTIGVEISQISRIERGIINTTVLTIHKIAEALQVSPKEFFETETKTKAGAKNSR